MGYADKPYVFHGRKTDISMESQVYKRDWALNTASTSDCLSRSAEDYFCRWSLLFRKECSSTQRRSPYLFGSAGGLWWRRESNRFQLYTVKTTGCDIFKWCDIHKYPQKYPHGEFLP